MKKFMISFAGVLCFLIIFMLCYEIMAKINNALFGILALQSTMMVGIISWFLLLFFIVPLDYLISKAIVHKIQKALEHRFTDTYYP